MPGRVTRWKGQIDFLKIIALLSKEYSNIHGLIVGDVAVNKQSFIKELEAKVIELGIYQMSQKHLEEQQLNL